MQIGEVWGQSQLVAQPVWHERSGPTSRQTCPHGHGSLVQPVPTFVLQTSLTQISVLAQSHEAVHFFVPGVQMFPSQSRPQAQLRSLPPQPTAIPPSQKEFLQSGWSTGQSQFAVQGTCVTHCDSGFCLHDHDGAQSAYISRRS
jgi:hypothetical protein